ncbi:MAG: endopeptidase La, partial [Candidatus Cloacimonetes bacterium]|nr:endopeptidase La [Candidatus Cloacimonadota bacterium]
SILSNRKVKHNIAMTGEITLSGNVLPIGGLAEKLIAAKRAKIKIVLVPSKNEPSLTEVNEEIKKGLKIILVDTIEEVLQYALH